jgi:two-component system, sensor histidine kinase PdtaS
MTLTSQSLFRPRHRIATSVSGPDIMLPSHKATSVALILNELIQNAIEHGFEERMDGMLSVTLTDDEGQIALVVENDGAPLPPGFDPKQSNSLGLQIVESLAREDLGGRFVLESGARTRATVAFPR